MLFKMEAAVRMGYTREACTDGPCRWNSCFTGKVQGAPISKITFYSSAAKEQLKSQTRQNVVPPSTPEEQLELLEELHRLQPKAVGLCAFSNFADSFVSTKHQTPVLKVPNKLTLLYDVKNSEMNPTDFSTLCKKRADELHLSAEQVEMVELNTRTQSSCSLWHDMRAGRITASVAHDVTHTSLINPAKSLVKKICKDQYDNQLNIPSIKHGVDSEHTAFEAYTQYVSPMHQSCSTKKCGLYLSTQFPFLGASPDAIVNCSCCGKGVVEIKCPYKHRDATICEALLDKDFCLDNDANLKATHRYYTQIHVQMAVCDVSYADLVIWTRKEMAVQRVSRDDSFIMSIMTKMSTFWHSVILPELLTNQIQNLSSISHPSDTSSSCTDTTTRQLFCICRSPEEDEDMVACDMCDKWFHIRCIKLKKLPTCRVWYCKSCKNKKLKRK